MIEVKGLKKKYGSTVAVDDLSFTVRPGQVYGFLGPNGAGKSTTMNIMTGCLAATSGQVLINGHDIFEEPVEAKKCIGYLPEIPPVYIDLTPVEYLTFAGRAKGLHGIELKNCIIDVCSKAGIEDVKNRLIKNLSKGYRQRVGFAQAILGDPGIIILDEPTVGLDPIQIIEIRALIKQLGENHTVILSSHILSEVSAVCDEILIISKGKLVACDTPDNLSNAFSDETVITLQVRGTAEKTRDTVKDITGVKNLEISLNSDDTVTCRITTDSEVDLREQIFYAMQGARLPVLSMSMDKANLEDVFLKLTEGEIPEDIQNKLRRGISDTTISGGEN